MMAVNLGTRGIDAACNLVEYCNHPGGTAWSDLRIEQRRDAPLRHPLWCLGNEMDGPWQIGHKTAARVRSARRRGGARRCAASTRRSSWSRAAAPTADADLRGVGGRGARASAYDLVDYVSLHAYYEQHGDDRRASWRAAVDMDHMIERVIATSDHVGAAAAHRKRLELAFDEWNVWYQQRRRRRCARASTGLRR